MTHVAVQEATDRWRAGRLSIWDELPHLAATRDRAREIREATVSDLRRQALAFAEAAEAAGAHVAFCDGAVEARGYVLDVCRRNGASLVAKSKSMVTEEIRLNPALQAAGVRVVETDLGEYIVQLAGDTPAHIVGPSLGKTAGEVAELFTRAAGRKVSPDLEELTQTARGLLREVFLAADVGITGANFGVVETGTLCLVTNEGNGRMVSSLPKVHIAVMGMERLVPSLDDLSVLLGLLPGSATGQRMTAYTTLITGPRRAGETDGPDELHIVIVDNGRTGLLGTRYEQMLTCIRCGACLNVCPVYRHAGGQAYSPCYSGPMGAVLVPLLNGLSCAQDLPQASSLCGACTDACPVQIPLHELLLELRRDVNTERRSSPIERLAFTLWSAAWSSRLGYDVSTALARTLQPLASAVAPHWSRLSGRTLPRLAERRFRDTWPAGPAAEKPRRHDHAGRSS